ncbi:low-specificity L-threonine aldolase [Chloroflexota bacterium]
MQTIDLRSDTVTLPTDEMRQAMYEAQVGDDVFREDPTINNLEELAAKVTGKEAALFTTSGTMANLIAILTHTHPGDEIIVGSEAHTFQNEVGGASALGGVVMRTVPNDENGQINLDLVEQAIRSKNIHFPETTLLCLENTHNRCGGAVLTPEYTEASTELAHNHGLEVHLDGARIFNAAVALNVPVTDLTNTVDSVCFCVSKGLSAPIGSLLCGSQDFVDRARKYRKMLGGGMRQAGVIAAAGIVAIQKMVPRLTEDHANAQRLAEGLGNTPGIIINPEVIKTNIVIFNTSGKITADEFIRQMGTRQVKFSGGGQRVRAVTHRLISEADVDKAIDRISILMKELK